MRLAETADPSARRSREHVARVAAQLDDCRAVLAWTAAEGEDELRWRLATAMSDVWQTRGHYAEARRWLEDGLEGARLPELLRLDALDDASAMALRQGDWAAVEDLGRSELDLARRLDRTRQVVGALAKLAQAAIAGGRHEAARAMHAEALALASADADRRPLLVSLTSQANADLLEGRCTEAATAFAQALPIAREVGRPESVATAQFNLGLAWLLAGDPAAARDHLAGALAAYVELDDADGIGYVLVAAAALRAAEDPQAAAVALGASGAALASVGSSLEAVESQLRASTLEALAARLGTALEASVARGAAAAPEAWPAIARDALAAPGVEAAG
jgi:tetratricopeptide (TPR) repeat protein